MTVIGLVLLLATAHAGDALSRQAIAEAEWSRDVDALLTGPFEPEDLPRVARALGRTRDPAVLDRLALLARQSDVAVRAAASSALGWIDRAGPVLRERLDRETVLSIRASLLRGLGDQGDATDVPRLLTALARPFPEGAAAAVALSTLARRGEDVSAAVDPLVATLSTPDARRVAAAAFALQRIGPRALAPAEAAQVERALSRAGDESTRAWLLPLRLAQIPPASRRPLELAILAGPYRAQKVALLDPASGATFGRAELERLSIDADPWVAQTARRRLQVEPIVPDRLDAALHGETPSARTAAATALLSGDPPLDVVTRLAGADDPAVRDLAADALSRSADPEAFTALQQRLCVEAAPEPLATVLSGLTRGVADGRRLDPATALRVRELAATGPFLIRSRAHEVARVTGLALAGWTPVLPGPPDLDRDLDDIARIRSARVSTTEGTFRVTLDPDTAPLSVAAFASLAEHGALDDLPFHRVVPAFVVQSGDPRGDGAGGPGWFLPDEVSELPFVAGALGMATAGPDTGGSQWFVTTTPQPHLAGHYTRFGIVSDGLDLVRRLDEDDRVLHVEIERVPVSVVEARR